MCRFTLYMGPEIRLSKLITEPDHSIIHQSYQAREREEPLNGDGFGIAWYAHQFSPHPAVFKEVQPAWSSLNLLNLAPVSKSTCVMAHVRAASPGLPVHQLNCHPFSVGRLAFMHNGEVAGFADSRRAMKRELSDAAYDRILGSTDSEVLFAGLLDRLGDPDGETDLETMAQVVAAVIANAEEHAAAVNSDETAFLNLALSDGRKAVLSRYVTPGSGHEPQSLYIHRGARYKCEDGVCYMEPAESAGERSVIISSEPISGDPGWEAIEENTLVLIDSQLNVSFRSIETPRRLG